MSSETQESIGVVLMTDLVRELGTISKLMMENQKLLTDIRDLMVDDIGFRKKSHETLEELAGYGEVTAMTLGILDDIAQGMKRTPGMKDILEAYASAAAEVFPDDGDPDDDGDVMAER